MKNNLYKIIDNLDGYVFGVGITDDKLLDRIGENKNIIKCTTYNINSNININSDTDEFNKIISIKKIKKVFKKEKAKYIVCEIEDIKKFMNTFINDSIYISTDKIYFYGNSEYDYILLSKLYKIYKANIEIKEYKNGFILVIDIKNIKTKIFRNILVKIVLFFNGIIETINNILNK